MKKLLNQKEQWYADTLQEAEEIVEKAKEDGSLTMCKITEKHNKYGAYRLVDLTFSYHMPKELMEEKERAPENTAPDGQLTIDEIENKEGEDK